MRPGSGGVVSAEEPQPAPSAGGATELVASETSGAAADQPPEARAVSASSAPEVVDRPPDEPSARPPEEPGASAPADALETTSAPDAGRPGVPALAAARDDLTADGILSLLPSLFPTGRALHWGASLDTLGPITAGLPENLNGWCEGRVWGAQGEVRWQATEADHFSVLYLGEGDTPPDGFHPLTTDLRSVASAEPDGLVLWGAREADGQYRELRLPRPLDYSAVGATGVQAHVPCRLLVDAAGQVRFIRLTVAESME